jgi:peptide/nickel transport system ATP-binding protein
MKGDNEKFFKRAENIRKRLEKIEKVDKPKPESRSMNLNINTCQRSGKDVIKLEDGFKKFKNKIILSNANLHFRYGEKLALIGNNGCGKSTLGRTIIRLLPATDGIVEFEGENILKYSNKKIRKMSNKMQIIFQDPYSSLDPRMTVSQIIAEPLLTNGLKATEKEILPIMDMVGLARRYYYSYPHELDGGRRQRIGIGRALSLSPKFIVCDEPVSALDVSIQAQILNLMKQLQRERGLTYLFITHDLSVVRHFSDDIAVMYLGKLVELADAGELVKNPLHPYTRGLLSAVPIADPDLEASRQRIVLEGDVPSPVDPPPGCRFRNRCRMALPKCAETSPELQEVAPGHQIACFVV